MKKAVFGAAGVCFLVGCSSSTPPEVTPEMVRAGTSGSRTFVQLQHGRTLFASRCIECHTLPAIAMHTQSEWPRLVNLMADRANLKPDERDTVLAYILAARAQSR
jgi:mono/diheme cytochrome c family protein